LKMNNLIIGNTSQIAHYFPRENFKFISSRDIDFAEIKKKRWNTIFLCFGEQRTFLKDCAHQCMDINFDYTLCIINKVKKYCTKIVVYSTAELWNEENGPIDLSTPFNHEPTPYLLSKERLTRELFQNSTDKTVTVLFPFNFNSVYRKPGFLFSKIFDSIINKKQIKIGNTYFYRDLLHSKFVVEESLKAKSHQIIGSGRIVHVNDFIRDLYGYFNMTYENYVLEDLRACDKKRRKNVYFLNSPICLYAYKQLFEDTIKDLQTRGAKT